MMRRHCTLRNRFFFTLIGLSICSMSIVLLRAPTLTDYDEKPPVVRRFRTTTTSGGAGELELLDMREPKAQTTPSAVNARLELDDDLLRAPLSIRGSASTTEIERRQRIPDEEEVVVPQPVQHAQRQFLRSNDQAGATTNSAVSTRKSPLEEDEEADPHQTSAHPQHNR